MQALSAKLNLPRGAVIAALSAAAVLAMAGDLSYDPRARWQKELFEKVILETRTCMAGGIRGQLTIGARDRDEIIKWVTEGECGQYLYNVLTQNPDRPLSANDARLFVRGLANDELNRIPGLKQSKPKPGPAISPEKANRKGLDAYREKNYAEAMRWYRTAADKGLAKAQYNIGVLYTSGLGVPNDYAEAARWYRKAADQGFAPAQYYLGVLYENGAGMRKDKTQARYWYD